MECGADSWMAKPFDPSELIQKVESVLAASDKRAKNISLTA
jgi:DNA-binding response OmpR family regulator